MTDLNKFAKNGLIEAGQLAELLAENASGIKLVDASYIMPGAPVSAHDKYLQKRIDAAVFFDIDRICDPESSLPHMVPTAQDFARDVSALGIGSDDFVIVYDQSGIAMAASRVWWMFRLFGHDRVCVLNGGLPYWQACGLPLNADLPAPVEAPGEFKTKFRPQLLKKREDMLEIVRKKQSSTIIDARTTDRFTGQAPEPRPGMRSGHIPGSFNLPFPKLIDPATGRLKDKKELETIFNNQAYSSARVTTCGSGVTACVLNLALHRLGHRNVAVYDGSWTEWGQSGKDTPVSSGP